MRHPSPVSFRGVLANQLLLQFIAFVGVSTSKSTYLTIKDACDKEWAEADKKNDDLPIYLALVRNHTAAWKVQEVSLSRITRKGHGIVG